jgi:hypothetical protein
MSTTTITGTSRRELATRVNGGVEITLVWDRRDNSTSIDIRHATTDETISFRVPPGRALDAFHHPFAHLANQVEDDLQPHDLDNPWRN